MDSTLPRDRFPIVELRPFVLYRPPGPQAMRRPSPREAYADARQFIQRCTRVTCETLLSERTVGAITLPQEVRLAATMYVRPNPALRASVALFERARWEGFLPDEALRAAWSDLYRRLCSEVSVSFEERQDG